MNIKKELQQLINVSELNTEDKKIWLLFIENSNEDDLIDILKVIQDDEKNLKFFTKNIKSKLDAFLSQDDTKIDDIIEEEKEHLVNM